LKSHTLKAVAEAKAKSGNESEFRAELKRQGIDVLFRKNEDKRIYGVTFIDHTTRTVLNGSRLGKEFSANVFNELFNNQQNTQQQSSQQDGMQQKDSMQSNSHREDSLTSNNTLGGIFSGLIPEPTFLTDDNTPAPKKKKKKRMFGRQG
jgi:hypothetical protein